MNIINRYALKKEFYLFKLVGLVLVLNVVLLLGWSREHWAQSVLNELENVTINGLPATSDNDITSGFGRKILAPDANGIGGPLPSDNLVVVNGSVADSVATFIIGGLNYNSNSDNNTVILNNSANVSGFVFGGYGNGTINATNNKVVVNTTVGVDKSDYYGGVRVVGGFSDMGYVEGNEVIFINGSIATDIIGGGTVSGTARNNKVIFNGISGQVRYVYGAYTLYEGHGSVNMTNNTVEVYNVKDNSNIIINGANGNDGNIDNNSVIVENSSLKAIYGAVVEGYGSASGNSILIKNSEVELSVFGSRFHHNTGNSTGNSVKLENSSADEIYSSYIPQGSANSTNNSVELENSSANKIFGSNTMDGKSTNNSVKLINSAANIIYGSHSTTGVVTDNYVDVSGGEVTDVVYGGYIGSDHSSYELVVSGNKVRLVGTDAVNIFGGYARDNSVAIVSFNTVEVTGGNVTGDIAGGRASRGQAFNNTVVINDTIKDIQSVMGGYSNSSLADNNTVILKNVKVAGDVYGGYSNTTSSANFTSNNAVTLAGVEIGGHLIGGNQKGVNNNLIFDSGPRDNLVNGSVNASGELLIRGGSNTIKQSTNVGKLSVTGGQTNVFNSNVSVTGDISIAGGDKNIFLAGLYSESGDIIIAAGENKFHDLITKTTNNITVSGPSVNYYQGHITTQKFSLNGGTHYFVSTQSVNTIEDVVASSAQVELGAGSALTFGKSLRIAPNSVLKLGGSASLKTTGSAGLDLAGSLDLGVHDLSVKGNVTFTSNSTLKIEYDGTDQGSLTATGQIKLSGTEPINLVLSNNNNFDPYSPIITATTSGVLELTAENFNAPADIFVNDVVPNNIYLNLRTSDNILACLENTRIYIPNENDKNFVNALNDQETFDAFHSILKLANDNGNMDILKRFLRQSSGETMLNVNVAIVDTVNQFQGAVNKRLDQVYGDNNAALPPAAGSEDAFNRLWVGGHGSWARQKNRAGLDGYDFHGGGFSLGYDRRIDGISGLRFGLTTSFSVGQMESDNGWTTIDSDTAGFGVYGSYQIDSGLFFDAALAYAHSKNNAKNFDLNGGWKKGDFAIDTWRIGARVGQIFDLGNIKLTPTVGLSYIDARQDGWAESVHGTASAFANVFDKKSTHIVEVPLLLQINGFFLAGAAKIIPEIRLGGTWVAQKPDNKLSVGLVNRGPDRWTVTGIKPASGSFQAGAGVKVEINDYWDVFVNYELDAARGYVSHNAALGVGFSF